MLFHDNQHLSQLPVTTQHHLFPLSIQIFFLQVAALTAQLAALQDERELQAGVVSDLERILARIEHAGASPVRGGSSKTAVAGGSLAAVSKQLVQAKLAEADAQRKLRVSAAGFSSVPETRLGS